MSGFVPVRRKSNAAARTKAKRILPKTLQLREAVQVGQMLYIKAFRWTKLHYSVVYLAAQKQGRKWVFVDLPDTAQAVFKGRK